MREEIFISTNTIFKVILIALAFVFVYLIRDILAMLFAALIIASAISRPVNWLQKKKVPRLLGTFIAYLAVFVIFVSLLYVVLPPLAQELKILVDNLPQLIDKVQNSISSFENIIPASDLSNNLQVFSKISTEVGNAAGNIFTSTIAVFGGFFSFLVILVLSVYLTLQQAGLKHFVLSLLPSRNQVYAVGLIDRIENRIGAWVLGQIILALIIGVVAFVGLTVLGVKYALVLAIVAGALEVVPYVGPILTAIIVGIIAFWQSPILGLWSILLFWLIQQTENYLIVPQVMKKAVGLNPLIVILAILIGGKLSGFVGILLAVPIAAVIAEILRDLQKA